MRRPFVVSCQDRSGGSWDVTDRVILANEGLDRVDVINHMAVRNSTSPVSSRRMRSMCRKPGIRIASIPGITSPRTTASYASAFSGVVQPRQIRQIIEEPSTWPTHPYDKVGLSASTVPPDGVDEASASLRISLSAQPHCPCRLAATTVRADKSVGHSRGGLWQRHGPDPAMHTTSILILLHDLPEAEHLRPTEVGPIRTWPISHAFG